MTDLSKSAKLRFRPTVSVVIPLYNGANTIAETLDSVFNQTKQPDEIIIVDDGSKDNSLTIAESYGERITIIKQSNNGHASARNTGIATAKGDFIACLDADDLWRNDKLEKQLELCYDNDIIYTGVQNFGDCERVDRHTFQNSECISGDHLCPLILDNFIAHSSVLIKREAILDVGGYDQSFFTAPDWDLWLRLAEAGKSFYGIPEPVTYYRWSTTSNSKNHLRACEDRIRVLTKAFDRSNLERVPESVRRNAMKNVWLTSAWFAEYDMPLQAFKWYIQALKLNPTARGTWMKIIRLLLAVLRIRKK